VIRKYFQYTLQLHSQPSGIILVMLFFRNFIFQLLGNKSRQISLRQFSYANNLPAGADPSPEKSFPEIEILFVSTQKDFSILPNSILSAMRATSHHRQVKVVVIVPDKEVSCAKEQITNLIDGIKIQAESQYISEEQFESIRQRFKSRAGWVIQQILKVEYVSRSTAPGVLVVDSDTILLSKREWLTEDLRQILCPSWEWHEPYYAFLAHVGFDRRNLKHSFISHHMLMQPKYMREARAFVSWQETDVLIRYLIDNADSNQSSPFCIEFELYAQFMLENHPEKVTLVKWSNIGIPRNAVGIRRQVDVIQAELKGKFASVSLHSYL
jgi:hypothetical protein